MLYTHLLYMKPEMSGRQEDKKPKVHKVEEVANQSSQVQFWLDIKKSFLCERSMRVIGLFNLCRSCPYDGS